MADNVIQKNWQELIRPDKLQVSVGSNARREATVVAEPLERGFGLTLGNALRRILLSSLQGAAVQSVHIDGVLHEFSSISGVREDVTDIVLNIKDIAIKMQGDGPKRMVVKKQGPGQVTAGDILAHARDRGKLVQHTVDMHRGDGRALKRREQYAAKRIAKGEPKTPLQRFGHDQRKTRRVAARRDVELGGLDEILPVLLQHLEGPFLVLKRGRLAQLARIRV